MEQQKPKKSILKKVLIGFGIFFGVILILSKLFPIDYYNDGIDFYNKKKYEKALDYLSKVETTDKNYNDAIIKIKELTPIVDSINKVAENLKTEKETENKNSEEKISKTENKENVDSKITEEKTDKKSGVLGLVGQSYNVGKLTYKVERVKFKKFIGGLYTLNKADGVFLIITLTVTNKDKKQIDIDNSYFKLVDEVGSIYEYSPDATATLEISQFPGETFMGMTINPQVSRKAKVVFEVPTKNKNYKLIFSDPYTEEFLEIEMKE